MYLRRLMKPPPPLSLFVKNNSSLLSFILPTSYLPPWCIILLTLNCPKSQPALNNAANALTYGLMSVGCTIAGGVANKITSKWTLVLGAAFYTPYAAGLYCNNRYGNQWFMLLGAGLCGVGASMLWASEAAIAVGYPQEAKRGKYVGIWMAIRQCGPLIGGCISLALNVETDHRGKVSYETYLGLIAISALGAPCALLLSQPGKVVRSDGSRVPHLRGTSIGRETRAIWRQLKSPYLVLLIPVFLAGQFGVTYQGNYLTSELKSSFVSVGGNVGLLTLGSFSSHTQITSLSAPAPLPPFSPRSSASWVTLSPAPSSTYPATPRPPNPAPSTSSSRPLSPPAGFGTPSCRPNSPTFRRNRPSTWVSPARRPRPSPCTCCSASSMRRCRRTCTG